jgi:hypothetical protein
LQREKFAKEFCRATPPPLPSMAEFPVKIDWSIVAEFEDTSEMAPPFPMVALLYLKVLAEIVTSDDTAEIAPPTAATLPIKDVPDIDRLHPEVYTDPPQV